MASTIPRARQLVNHRHVLVNGRIIDIPSYYRKPRDIITASEKSRALIQNLFDSLSRKHKRKKVPYHLTLDRVQYKGLVKQIINTNWVGVKIKESLVVEYYSCQT